LNAAYPAAVDRLLASPHYGERWARLWLDSRNTPIRTALKRISLASSGHGAIGLIKAFNSNMPYDRFIREQVAAISSGSPTGSDCRDWILRTA